MYCITLSLTIYTLTSDVGDSSVGDISADSCLDGDVAQSGGDVAQGYPAVLGLVPCVVPKHPPHSHPEYIRTHVSHTDLDRIGEDLEACLRHCLGRPCLEPFRRYTDSQFKKRSNIQWAQPPHLLVLSPSSVPLLFGLIR